MSTALLHVEGLNAFYGRAHILFDLALDVHAGEVVGVMGRNGAGKSTTMKAIMGLLDRTRGVVTFRGQTLVGLAPYEIARLGVGFVPEDRRIFPDLTVVENLRVGEQPPRPGVPSWTIDRLFSVFPLLANLRGRPGGQLSGGEQQLLTVARTLMGNPRLILLDEPSEGVAPVVVEQMGEVILMLKREGVSILLAEQNVHFTSFVSDRAYVLEKGQICAQGAMADLMANQELLDT